LNAPSLKGRCVSCPIREGCVCQPLDEFGLQRPKIDDIKTEFEAGEVICRKGEKMDRFFQVVGGMVSLVHYSKDGKKTIFGFLFKGDWYGLFTQDFHLYTIEAAQPTELCFYEKSGFQKLVFNIPALEHKLKKTEEERYRWVMLHIKSLSLKTPAEKLKAFIAMLCFRWQKKEQEGKNLALPLGRADIASYLGLTPESVSRAFTSLKEGGLLEMPTSKHISVRNFKVLVEDVFDDEVLDF